MLSYLKSLLLLILLVISPEAFGSYNHKFDVRTIRKPVCAADINAHLKGKLAGHGQTFIEAQKTYGVSARFLAAVAMLESGHGSSRMCREDNNCLGLKGKKFKSIDECIMYGAKLISSDSGVYFGRKRFTIEAINRVYEPKNAQWKHKVASLMSKI